jgi:hypothetical protein
LTLLARSRRGPPRYSGCNKPIRTGKDGGGLACP